MDKGFVEVQDLRASEGDEEHTSVFLGAPVSLGGRQMGMLCAMHS